MPTLAGHARAGSGAARIGLQGEEIRSRVDDSIGRLDGILTTHGDTVRYAVDDSVGRVDALLGSYGEQLRTSVDDNVSRIGELLSERGLALIHISAPPRQAGNP